MKVKDFDLAQTLECGQCFNFEKLDENEYVVMAMGKVLHVKQEGDELCFFNASEDDIEKIWIPYFDLDRDYGEIKRIIGEADPRLVPIMEKYYGIRILNQDFPETLISFIISQNKNIPGIKKIVKAICKEYGNFDYLDGEKRYLDEKEGLIDESNVYYTFPELDQLSWINEQAMRDLKTGFRAPYIMNAIGRLLSDDPELRLDGKTLSELTYEEAKAKLVSIKGVGDKVANCVLLFSLGFRSAFPVDVWIKRVMEELYFEGDTPKPVIEKFAAEKFGDLGGYAQQYLFMYIKERDGDKK